MPFANGWLPSLGIRELKREESERGRWPQRDPCVIHRGQTISMFPSSPDRRHVASIPIRQSRSFCTKHHLLCEASCEVGGITQSYTYTRPARGLALCPLDSAIVLRLPWSLCGFESRSNLFSLRKDLIPIRKSDVWKLEKLKIRLTVVDHPVVVFPLASRLRRDGVSLHAPCALFPSPLFLKITVATPVLCPRAL